MVKNLDDKPTGYRSTTETEVTGNQARQGSAGRPVMYILGAALLLAIVAWAASEYYGRSIEKRPITTTQDQVPATTDQTTPGTTTTTPGTTTPGTATTTTPGAATTPATGTTTPSTGATPPASGTTPATPGTTTTTP